MIKRIVKLELKEENAEDFRELFEKVKERILASEGCLSVELLEDTRQAACFFTLSEWESEAHLEAYRQSDFFKTIWATTKTFFKGKPVAWSISPINGIKKKL